MPKMPSLPTPGLIDIVESRKTAWTIAEFCALLEISDQVIYRQIKANRLPCLKVGGSIRLDPKTTAEWLRQRMM